MSLGRLSLRDLEYVVAVADERHFGRAAERCHVSQPALSAQIRKLEEALGVVLFERTRRGVLLTVHGRRLIEPARDLLLAARAFLDLAALSDELAGELRLSAIATLGPYLFTHILRPLRDRFPALELLLTESRTERILAALAAGDTDLALLSLPVRADGLAVLPLFDEPFVAVHPADWDLAGGRPLRVEDLDAAHLLLLDEGHCLRDQALALCAGADRRASRHGTSIQTLCHMVAAGSGYSLVPALAAREGDSFGGLVAYTAIADPRAARRIGLVFRATDPRRRHYEGIAETIGSSLPPEVAPLVNSAGREAARRP